MRFVDRAVSIISGPSAVHVDHRLLAVDVLARLHRVHGGLLMPVVGRGDDHGINVLARKNLACSRAS